jgi:hypothetical protein
MELSISIVSYNTKDSLKECLSSLVRHIQDIEYEIIVVDNSSCDGSPDMIKQEFPNVRLIENNKNAFFTKANNQAIRISKGQYILLLNSDTMVIDNSIQTMLNFMSHHPSAGAVSGKILFPDGRLQSIGWNFHTPLNVILNQDPIKKIFIKKYLSRLITHNSSSITEVDVVSDGFMLLRREAIFGIGLYDERFLLYYTEDDLCRRLKTKGWKVYYLPPASVIHKLFGSTKKGANIKIAGIRAIDTIRYFAKYYKFHIDLGIGFLLLFGLGIEISKVIIKRIKCLA